MASLFGGNPFTTPVGQLIDKATDGSLPSENWGLNMEICDIINETEEGAKDGMKAIRKKLNMNVGKNYTAVMYTLTVLETCVKNCERRFHVLVANKDFLQELIKIIGPKNDPPQVVQEKILSLIQTWADAFRGSPDLKEVNKVYQDLKNKGIEFPMTDLDNLAPIHTPARTTAEPEPSPPPLPQRTPSARPAQPLPTHGSPQHQVMTPGPITLTSEQQGKLKSEMDIVQGNIRVFSEMLTELQPNQATAGDIELLQELNTTCREMQHRVVGLLEQVSNEEVTGELLHVNDDLNNAFVRYDRFERYRSGQSGQATEAPSIPAPLPPAAQPPPYSSTMPAAAVPSLEPPPVVQRNQPAAGAETATPAPATANLIDFDTSPSQPSASVNDVNLQFANMNVGGSSVSSQLGQISSTTATNTTDDFDMFAQSRKSFETSKTEASGNVYANQQTDQFSGGLGAAVNAKNTGNPYAKIKDKENDFEEMEKWLQENSQNQAGAANQKENVTSAEFDAFLASRAADGAPASNPNPAARNNSNRGRQLQKDDTENTLFAL